MHLRHQTQRVNPNPALQYLKMQVVACAVAGIAYITYNLPCRYRFTCGNGSLRHVGVPRGQTRAVIQRHLIAVAVVPATDQHRAAVGSQDMCALPLARECQCRDARHCRRRPLPRNGMIYKYARQLFSRKRLLFCPQVQRAPLYSIERRGALIIYHIRKDNAELLSGIPWY